jgi:hypothetical protein
LAATLVLTLGCGGPPPRQSTAASRPASFYPELFPDIPLLPGYVLDENEPPLAVAVAGGTVRRFEVALHLRTGARVRSGEQPFDWYGRVLPKLGWTPIATAGNRQEWRKSAERLSLETGRRDGNPTIRFRLRPIPSPAVP